MAGGTDPSGRNVPTHFIPFRINDKLTIEVEVEASVRCLCMNKADIQTHLIADHFKNWLREAYPMEGNSTHPNIERWRTLVDLMLYMWQHREITT